MLRRFVETADRVDRASSLKKNDNKLVASLIGLYPVSREKMKMTKVIGYIRVYVSDSFIAVTKPISLMPLVILAIAIIIALMLFVGIPLPGTGAWTGTLAASLLDMDFKSSILAVLLGVLLAGIIMGAASAGLFGAIGAVIG